MDATDDKELSNPDESGEDELEIPEGPDEQVALDRLTAAFAELLGSDDRSTDPPPTDESADDETPAEDETDEADELDETGTPEVPSDTEATILPVSSATAPRSARVGDAETGLEVPPFPISRRAFWKQCSSWGIPRMAPFHRVRRPRGCAVSALARSRSLSRN